MKGKVVLFNSKRGMAALITESGGYTSFEILGYEALELGDIVQGNLESLGSHKWYNYTKMEDFDVMIEDIYGSKKTALSIII